MRQTEPSPPQTIAVPASPVIARPLLLTRPLLPEKPLLLPADPLLPLLE